MYCKKCGVYIGTDDDFCQNCTEQADSVEERKLPDINDLKPEYDEDIPPIITKTFGLAKAIMACCFGFIALIMITTSALNAYEGYVALNGFDASIITKDLALENALITLFDSFWQLSGTIPLAILSVVFGIKAINKFKYACNQNNLKPVTTLIFGVIGSVLGTYALIYITATMVFDIVFLVKIINFI